MTTTLGAGGSHESFRTRVHGLLRTSILDAAWARACDGPWSQVRIADIAEDVGVSRQTIYNEFGAKDQLSNALFEREMARFLGGLAEISDAHDDIPGALRAMLRWMLDEVREHPLLRHMIADARRGNVDDALLVLTVRADFIVIPMRTALVDQFSAKWPDVPRGLVQLLTDLYVRFVMSQIVLPTDLDVEEMIELLVGMAITARTEAVAGS